MGHARAILSIEGKSGQIEAARKIIGKSLSVREAETLTKKWVSEAKKKTYLKREIPKLNQLKRGSSATSAPRSASTMEEQREDRNRILLTR